MHLDTIIHFDHHHEADDDGQCDKRDGISLNLYRLQCCDLRGLELLIMENTYFEFHLPYRLLLLLMA